MNDKTKPIIKDNEFRCEKCGATFLSTNEPYLDFMIEYVKFCRHCGKEIDWNEYRSEQELS